MTQRQLTVETGRLMTACMLALYTKQTSLPPHVGHQAVLAPT